MNRSMEVWTLEDGKAVVSTFDNRNEANAYWKAKNKDNVPMITNGPKRISVWNSTKQDWFVPMVESGLSGFEDSVEAYILSEVWEMTIFQIKKREQKTDPRFPGFGWEEGYNEWDVPVNGKRYRLKERFVREDSQFADMCGIPDKYVEYEFWDKDRPLASFCYET